MRTLGLIGGMSWESTVPYYQHINRRIAEELSGFHSARILLHSVNFHDIEALQREDRWDEAGDLLAGVASRLEDGGAECIVLCTNTMHRVADRIEESVTVPLLHIADATGEVVRQAGHECVGLLGTRFTMEQSFYRSRIQTRFGLRVDVPSSDDREIVHRVIYEELVHGRVEETSRDSFRRIVSDLVSRGCESVILGCTEIGLLLRPEDAAIPLYDTTRIHAEAAARFALKGTWSH